MQKVKFFDTTLRDGEQSPGVNLNIHEKLEIAKQLERLGVDVMEAGFPASSKGDFEAVSRIARTIKTSAVTGLARSVQSDIDAAWEALKTSECPRIHTFIATSPVHMKHKLRMTPDEVIEVAVRSVKYARQKFPIVQWSAEDACRTDRAFLVRIITEVIKAGATVINIPDTVGFITPQEYGDLFRYLRSNIPNLNGVDLSTHCHDDLGMATANALEAIKNGATQVECTINGIGERAGNAALEEVAVALHIREDMYQTQSNIVLKEINRSSQLVSKLTGMSVSRNKAIIGANAFAHESGIHQDGVLKEASTYEIITPELIGVSRNNLVLGKHSGRHAFKQQVVEWGFDFDEEKLQQAFIQFKSLTDKKKEVTDEDILTLLTELQTNASGYNKYELQSVQVQYGTANIPTATVCVKKPDGEVVKEAATGSGSVEAIYHTLSRVVEGNIALKDYSLKSVGSGRDALADAFVTIEASGIETIGRGSAQDVLEASAKAYLNAVNRVLLQERKKQPVSNI